MEKKQRDTNVDSFVVEYNCSKTTESGLKTTAFLLATVGGSADNPLKPSVYWFGISHGSIITLGFQKFSHRILPGVASGSWIKMIDGLNLPSV